MPNLPLFFFPVFILHSCMRGEGINLSFSKQLLKDLLLTEELNFAEVLGSKYGLPEASKKF